MTMKEYREKYCALTEKRNDAEKFEVFCIIMFALTVVVMVCMPNVETVMAFVFALYFAVKSAVEAAEITAQMGKLYSDYINSED